MSRPVMPGYPTNHRQKIGAHRPHSKVHRRICSQISGAVFSVGVGVADEVSGFGNGVGSDAGVLAIGEETSLKRLKSRWEFSDVQLIVITPLNPINNKNR
jgi:hypothetical protein